MIEKVKLRDIASVITKGTTPTSIGDGFIENGINFIKIESITEEGCFVKEKFAHISEECNSRLKRSQIEENDILFSIAGAIGRVAVVNSTVLPANTNQALAIIRVDNRYDKEFLAFLFRSSFIQKQYNKKKQGVAQINLSLKDIAELEIPIISIKKQLAIKENLNDIINIISLKKKQLKELNELIKSQFVEMFGDPLLNEKKWSIKLCKEVTTKIGSGATPDGGNQNYKEAGISLIRSMNVYDGYFEYKDLAHIDDVQAVKLKNVEIYENDVLFNITGASVTRTCVVPKDILPARVNQHVSIIRCNEHINYVFMNYLLMNESFKNNLLHTAKAGGGTREAITKNQIENFEIIVPPIELQNKFAEFVKKVDKQKFEVQKCLEEMQLLQESLMDKYFGEM